MYLVLLPLENAHFHTCNTIIMKLVTDIYLFSFIYSLFFFLNRYLVHFYHSLRKDKNVNTLFLSNYPCIILNRYNFNTHAVTLMVLNCKPSFWSKTPKSAFMNCKYILKDNRQSVLKLAMSSHRLSAAVML